LSLFKIVSKNIGLGETATEQQHHVNVIKAARCERRTWLATR
jgi:hypothetical protein